MMERTKRREEEATPRLPPPPHTHTQTTRTAQTALNSRINHQTLHHHTHPTPPTHTHTPGSTRGTSSWRRGSSLPVYWGATGRSPPSYRPSSTAGASGAVQGAGGGGEGGAWGFGRVGGAAGCTAVAAGTSRNRGLKDRDCLEAKLAAIDLHRNPPRAHAMCVDHHTPRGAISSYFTVVPGDLDVEPPLDPEAQ